MKRSSFIFFAHKHEEGGTLPTELLIVPKVE
jgi:hypothetical protein